MTAEHLIVRAVDYFLAFGGALLLTFLLTPLVRRMNQRLGMVDKPDARRINKVPVPRGGGLALVLGVYVSYGIFVLATGRPPLQVNGLDPAQAGALYWKLVALGSAIAALGFADDRFNLRPWVKLLGQVAVALLVWSWAGLGFGTLWSGLPAGLDCALTVFWIVGAVNAFNLIDGLDGLASGLALIATIGMAGTLVLLKNPQQALFYLAFAGGLLAFLRYNYNPASIFLGDCGSMFIGFTIATLPLISQTPNSFLVSVGVPLLAMGVPIFDTALAILRRSLRGVIRRRDGAGKGGGQVMTADSDHLHHRILRAVGLNQRKAAWILYGIAAFFVGVGLLGVSLDLSDLTGLGAAHPHSYAAGLWLVALTVAAVVIFKDMARIELFDAGRLLNAVVRDGGTRTRRRFGRLRVPFYVACDVLALVVVYFLCVWALRMPLSRAILRIGFPVQILSTFTSLVFFNTYRTVWARAMTSNYVRLFLACVLGVVVSAVVTYYARFVSASGGANYAPYFIGHIKAMALAYAVSSFVALALVRILRAIVRDTFYAMDCSRLKTRPDVSRVLVYGAGLRYRTFRRELVRTTSANNRMIVGLLDDDILLRGQYIGGMKIYGTLGQAPEIIRRTNADAVVVACVVSDEWLEVIRKTLAPTGVKVTLFSFSEKEIT